MKIGYMGAVGSFSEQASDFYATTNAISDVTLIPLVTAEGVLSALTEGVIDKAVFPVMNSIGGIVVEAMHAMGEHIFSIESMFDIDIHHFLLVKEGISAKEITTITSHDQAIKQCVKYLEEVFPLADVIRYNDTAQAAADLSNGVLTETTAVIAPRKCAELYGLSILESGIQDDQHNKTTFVVARRLLEK